MQVGLGGQTPDNPTTCTNGFAGGIANNNYTIEVENVCGNNSSTISDNNIDNNIDTNNDNKSDNSITSGRRRRKATILQNPVSVSWFVFVYKLCDCLVFYVNWF